MVECGNWPPSRGKNPWEAVEQTYEFGKVTVKDLPVPKQVKSAQREAAQAEKGIIAAMMEEPPKPKMPLKAMKQKPLTKRKDPKLMGFWKVWVQVSDVASLTLEQAGRVLRGQQIEPKKHDNDYWIQFEPRTLWVDITYPLDRGVRLAIPPVTRTRILRNGEKIVQKHLFLGHFLWRVAKEYERIYKEHKKYGIWGHALEDLGFEQIRIDKDGVVDLFIGS